MPEEKKIAANATSLAESLFGSMGRATANPLAAVRVPITRAYRIVGQVVWEDTGEPVKGITLGLGGIESRTDDQGRFTIAVEKK
jgi:hypothetical protein